MFNGLIAIFFFELLITFKVKQYIRYILTLTFLTITYSVSGTPFLDLHSTFLSLFAFFCFWIYLAKKNFYILVFIPIFFILAFFSKPTPTGYFFLIFIIIYLYYFFVSKDYKSIKYLILGSLISLFCVLLFLLFNKININLFLTELFLYPLSIGEDRFIDFNFNLTKIISNYKFILITVLFIIYLIIEDKKNFEIRVVGISLILITIILIYHQLMTKNQNFIFFLIPMNISFAFFAYNQAKLKKISAYTILFFCIIVTIKYHYRFNEERKFHDLHNTNLKNSIPATLIDKSLYPLKWITAGYGDPKEEINLIKKVINILDENNNQKLLISNYLFIDALTLNKVYALSRTYDEISFPRKKNKYYNIYKKFLEDKIKKNKINKIYLFFIETEIREAKYNYLYSYVDQKCFSEKEILPELIELSIDKTCFK